MHRLLISILVVTLVFTASIAQSELSADRRPVTVIIEMIKNAETGEVLHLPPGIYEGNLIIQKPIVLDGSAGVVFDGLGTGTVIEVLADQVTIRKCTIQNSGIE